MKHLRRVPHTALAQVHIRVDIVAHVVVGGVGTCAGQRSKDTVETAAVVLLCLVAFLACVALVVLDDIYHIRLDHVVTGHENAAIIIMRASVHAYERLALICANRHRPNIHCKCCG